ncbi:HlyD family type I secretion periplasmic adaptor subunit [Ensifer sp. ZNC0028]
MSGPTSKASRAIRRYMLIAGASTAALLVGVGGWAATSKLSGAVVGMGTVAIEGNVKRIQHREGGIVGEIRVRDGSQVKAGELLLRLDDTLTRANLAMVSKQIDQLTARAMRLTAERDNAPFVTIPEELKARLDHPEIADYVQSERALFVARRETIQGQKAQLQQRISQLQQEADGVTARRLAKDDELRLIQQELSGVSVLHEKGLMPFSRLAELQRIQAQLSGERGQLTAEIARAATRRTETELQILQLDQDRRSEVLTELRDVENKLTGLTEQQVTAKDQLRRVELLAPQDGIVHELAVHTVGGVISPGETIMQIVPIHESLVIDAKVQPADIDQLHIGQGVVLRFSAFNQRTTPEINGNITTIAASLSNNPQTGEAWYSARIKFPKPEFERLGGLALHAGMPVEAFIQTGERTALSYFIKPLADQITRAMREE